MKHTLIRASSALSLALIACSTEPARGPSLQTKTSDLTGITGANCDGIAAGMTDPNGVTQAAQSIIRLYNLKLQGQWTKIAGQTVLDLSLPAAFEQTNQVYPQWEAKSGNLFRARNALAYGGGDYYPGVFGFLDEVDVPEGTCSAEALDDQARDDGTLGQVAVSQAGPCGQNENGSIKFWQVNGLTVIPIGTVLDAQELIDAGMATAVTSAPMDRCIIPDPSGDPGTLPPPTPDTPPDIPCLVAFRTDAVTEGVVLRVPSMEVVAGVPLGMRPFTAAGVVAMPNGLDTVRTVVRSAQFRAMFAIGRPTVAWLGGTTVQITGHRIGPAQSPSSVLRPEERGYIDQLAGTYDAACCHQECTPTSPAAASTQLTREGDPATLVAGDGGGGMTCTNVCIPEGQCETGSVGQGLIVMVSSVTTKECFGSCPEPAANAPSGTPTCSL